VPAEEGLDLGVAAAVLGEIGEGHAVVGQPGPALPGMPPADRCAMDLVGEHLDDLAQEGGAVRLGVGVQEGDMGEAWSIART